MEEYNITIQYSPTDDDSDLEMFLESLKEFGEVKQIGKRPFVETVLTVAVIITGTANLIALGERVYKWKFGSKNKERKLTFKSGSGAELTLENLTEEDVKNWIDRIS